jgi:hypothetical protein
VVSRGEARGCGSGHGGGHDTAVVAAAMAQRPRWGHDAALVFSGHRSGQKVAVVGKAITKVEAGKQGVQRRKYSGQLGKREIA